MSIKKNVQKLRNLISSLLARFVKNIRNLLNIVIYYLNILTYKYNIKKCFQTFKSQKEL